MNKIIRLNDTSDNEYSIESMQYISFGGGQVGQMTPQQMERDDNTLALCSMIYALRFLEADVVREKAFQAGYEAGQETAAKEIQDAIDSQRTLHEALKKALEDITSLKDAILDQAEGDILQLVTAIAKKLVCRELRQNPDTIVAVVKEAIKTARTGDEIIIRIHPDDYATLEQHLDELRQSLERAGGDGVAIRIASSPELTPGGCIVETDTNLIDMSLEMRMESLFSTLDA